MVIVLGLLVLSGALRLVRLSEPHAIVFDETYYAKDACLYLGHEQGFCKAKQATEQSWVHPPLGKWLIATGIGALGYREVGWRAAAALAGTALTLAVFLFARKLFQDRWVATVAGLLVATDFLLIVQSRVAMLDIFLAFFVVMGFMFLAIDRERMLAVRDEPMLSGEPARSRGWRLASGVAFGLAVSVKWSAVWALAGASLLSIIWSIWLVVSRRRQARDAPGRRALSELGSELATSAIAFGLVPLAVYLLSYSMWFAQHHYDLRAFADLQSRMLDYHLTLKSPHSYQSKAWTWPLLLRPVAYYWNGKPQATHILAVGNPATWYASLVAGVWLLVRSARRRSPERTVAVAWGSQYLPWIFVARPLFLFYMTPVVPFMMVGLAAALGALRRRGPVARWLVRAYLLVAVGVLTYYFYPVIAAVGLPHDWWLSRMWFPKWI